MSELLDLAMWGLTSALSFLVLALAYRLLTPAQPRLVVLVPVAILVGLVGGLLAHLGDRLMRRRAA